MAIPVSPVAKSDQLEQRMVGPPPGCVTFQTDTNGRFNFPSQKDFNSFCKQRDMFYSVRQAWIDNGGVENDQEQHSHPKSRKYVPMLSRNNQFVPGAQQDFSGVPKIPSIIEINGSTANLSHFASLFLSQYVLDNVNASLFVKPEVSSEAKEIKSDQLRQLYESNPSRFNQLQNRFSQPLQKQPRDTDSLAFQKHFITTASSPAFNQHLIDRAVQEITEIEGHLATDIPSDISEIESMFRKCKLLGQLTGFVLFLAYNNPVSSRPFPGSEASSNPSTIEKETHMNQQIKLRSYHSCPLPLETMLLRSLKEGRLIFTLTWIVELLLRADCVVPQLPNYKKIFCCMHRIHQELSFPTPNLSSSQSPIRTTNALENICEVSQKCIIRHCENLFSKFKSFGGDGSINTDILVNCKQKQISGFEEDYSCCLDSNEDIGKSFMKICFGETWNAGDNKKSAKSPGTNHLKIKNISSSNVTASSAASPSMLSTCSNSSGPSPRRISITSTPIPKHIVPTTVTHFSKEMKLQMQLETSFFEMHPTSVKKTVEFIAERVASNFVKHIRSVLYPQERILLIQQEIFQEEAAKRCRQTLSEKIDSGPKEDALRAAELLIGDSLCAGALTTCKNITVRKCTEKVQEWLNTHINKGNHSQLCFRNQFLFLSMNFFSQFQTCFQLYLPKQLL